MSSSKQRRGKAGIVFLIQALAFFLFSERTKVSSASKRFKEPPAKTSLDFQFSCYLARQSIIITRAVPMVLTSSLPCTETATYTQTVSIKPIFERIKILLYHVSLTVDTIYYAST